MSKSVREQVERAVLVWKQHQNSYAAVAVLCEHATLFASSEETKAELEEVRRERDALKGRIDAVLAKTANFDTDYAVSLVHTIEAILTEGESDGA